jgi:SH3 domain protein
MWGIVKAMRLGVLFVLCFLAMVIPAHSETAYITDDIRVMLRSDAGTDRRIIAMPKSGTQVEVLEQSENGWSKVRLADEKEGWLLTRYLGKGPPSRDVIARLKSENEVLKRQAKTLTEENVRLKRERNDFEKALSKQTKTAQTLRESYETLRKGSSEFLSLKASYDKASEGLATKTKRQAELEEELKALQESQTLRWFVGGAAVLFVGLIVGFMARRPRRRPSLL